MDLDFKSLFTSLDGRINRAQFWVGAAGILVILMIVDGIFGSSVFGRILKFLLAIGLFYPAYAVTAKRFQDRDKPGETALYGLIPVLVAIVLGSFGLTGDPTGANALGWICTSDLSRRRALVRHRARHPQRHARAEPLRRRSLGSRALETCASAMYRAFDAGKIIARIDEPACHAARRWSW